jgi:hypothetical protein
MAHVEQGRMADMIKHEILSRSRKERLFPNPEGDGGNLADRPNRDNYTYSLFGEEVRTTSPETNNYLQMNATMTISPF